MKKKNLALILSGILLLAAAVFLFVFTNNTQGEEKWDDPEYVFNIDIPEDFEPHEIERVNMKIAQVKEIYDDRGEDNWVWVSLGNLYQFVNDFDRAIQAYEKSLEMFEYDLTSTLSLASIYQNHVVDLEKAEMYYKKAIDINEDSADLYDRLAKFYYQKVKDVDAAEAIYLKGLEKTNNHPDLINDIIHFYGWVKKPEEQKKFIKIILELYPENTKFQKEFGHLLEEK
jgi:tetratricopeptide (TPR) repeat protein